MYMSQIKEKQTNEKKTITMEEIQNLDISGIGDIKNFRLRIISHKCISEFECRDFFEKLGVLFSHNQCTIWDCPANFGYNNIPHYLDVCIESNYDFYLGESYGTLISISTRNNLRELSISLIPETDECIDKLGCIIRKHKIDVIYFCPELNHSTEFILRVKKFVNTEILYDLMYDEYDIPSNIENIYILSDYYEDDPITVATIKNVYIKNTADIMDLRRFFPNANIKEWKG